ncbi:MAG: hypothetical protein PVG39_04545 [Desulfobacteraceae bacterium]
MLIGIMTILVFVVEGISIGLLYRTALNETRARLEETAKGQASLINAVSRFDKKYSEDYLAGSWDATLSQIVDAHEHYRGFGKTGEFTLSRKNGDMIVFLLSHRHYDLENPKPVPFNSNLAEPMRLALQGKSGTVIGLDYRGEMVMAAYEPVQEMGLGIVAKIDLSEVRQPFIKAGIISSVIGIIILIAGSVLFVRVTSPLIAKLRDTISRLETALKNVKVLKGLIPICASCKKIRDDRGYWNHLESYIKVHSDADFTHGLCPECTKKLYPEISD